jgi:REP element-mobilizing transposase RayT
MTNINSKIWHWYHNVSECYYHIQITVKYRQVLLNEKVQEIIKTSLFGIKERYAIEISHYGFDQNHLHILAKFLPTYSGGQVIKIIKSISAKQIFLQAPEVKQDLWGGEFWTDGYYIATVSGRGDKRVIEKYIINQGREEDSKQLRLFEF